MDIANPALTGEGLAARLHASEWTPWRAAQLRDYLAKQDATAAQNALRARLARIDAGEDEEAAGLHEAAYNRMTARLHARGDDGVWEELEEGWQDLGSAHRRVHDLEVAHKLSYPALWVENALKAAQYYGAQCAYREWQDRQRA